MFGKVTFLFKVLTLIDNANVKCISRHKDSNYLENEIS